MTSRHKLPIDPIAFVKRCFHDGSVLWTYHVNMRLKGRGISREIVRRGIEVAEVIESYPDDKYLPSCLLRAEDGTMIFHVLVGFDPEGDAVRVVTAYVPDPRTWDASLRQRRRDT